MKLRYRYRVYPTPVQANRLAQMFGCTRVVWNDALTFCQQQYAQGGKYPGSTALMKQCITKAKQTEERSWLSSVSVVPLQQSVRDLDVAFRNFFSSVSGKRKGPKVRMPRFKKRHSTQTARFTLRGFSVGTKLYLAKIGSIKVQWSRALPSEPSSVTIIKDPSGRYFASFVVEKEPELLLWNDTSIGIDLGITTFATLSTGQKIEAPKPLKRYLKKLARLQKTLSRCEKGSNRRQAAKLKVAQLHNRIKDIRTDFLHKLSTQLIIENQEINLEELNVSGMLKNRRLSKAISDLGWRQFRTMLEAKATMYGRDVNVISRWEPTSQTCSCCGHREGRKQLGIREWQCLNCGVFHDRDINAALNIKAAGGHSEAINGCRRECKSEVNSAVLSDASTRLVDKQLELFAS
ncbi:RNA-guided endonuclease InsQ/TnpB family protein [Acaryochloris marina]|uniref:RNA-guided endonuclease InsQ/TnpB family protein n=1 Tax=Acaryochloris marina TaxID=155978 RepID=UPI0021C424D3|nr:transposase [Acaryochloris marina]BDM82888.1 transposase [Acaryochloris marina MBIC10699]